MRVAGGEALTQARAPPLVRLDRENEVGIGLRDDLQQLGCATARAQQVGGEDGDDVRVVFCRFALRNFARRTRQIALDPARLPQQGGCNAGDQQPFGRALRPG